MRYFNSNDVKILNESTVKTAGAAVILEDALFTKKASYQKCDVFLSHSSKDKDDLPAVIEFLKRFGVKAYVDKADDDLPKKTTSETGKIIKNRIAECKKFIVLVSDNSKESKIDHISTSGLTAYPSRICHIFSISFLGLFYLSFGMV